MDFRYGVRGTVVDHITSRYLIVKPNSGAFALATDATAEQPVGVIADGDDRDITQATVGVAGRFPVLVGAAGLTAGFHRITCDAASKAKSAAATDASLGYAHVPVALVANQVVDVFINPLPIDAIE